MNDNTDIVLKYINGTNHRFILYEDYERIVDGKKYFINNGFETDLASVPPILWSMIGPVGKHLPATIVHDYLYIGRKVPQKEADVVFLKLMKIDNVSFIKRYFMYYVVRLLGFLYYKDIIE